MFTKTQQATINKALNILSASLVQTSINIDSATVATQFCRLEIGAKQHEVFGVMFLNTQHQMIAFEEMFRGTINSASVYPREVAKRALELNAAAVIFTHNHPSGITEPSSADRAITERLVNALELLDIRVLDHIVVSATNHTSFAERGLL